MKNIADAAYLL